MTVAVRTANAWQWRMQVLDRQTTWSTKPDKLEAQFSPEDEKLKKKILEARQRLKEVNMPRELSLKISKLCSKLNVDGLRGDIVCNRAARALAAFEGRTEATELDVRRVAVSTLQHRLRKNVADDVD